MSNVVILKGEGIVKEALAAGAITPGHFVYRSSATEVTAGRTAAGVGGPKLVADINPEIGRALDNAYSAAEQVKLHAVHSGMEVNALVAAGATAITVGARLEVAADGTVQIVAVDAATDDTERDSVVGYALEAVDNSGGGAAVRIKMEVA